MRPTIKVRKPRDAGGVKESNLRKAARTEAKALLAVERNGCTRFCADICRNVADVVQVSKEDAVKLRAFAAAHPEEAAFVEEALQFRVRVAREIERLRAGGEVYCNVHQCPVQVVDGREECARCARERKAA